MTITISEGYNSTFVLSSNSTGFIKRFGKRYIVRSEKLFKEMVFVTDYVNNVLHSACLFEVEE